MYISQKLWENTQEMSEDIKIIDPTNVDDIDVIQMNTDAEVSLELHPLEQKSLIW